MHLILSFILMFYSGMTFADGTPTGNSTAEGVAADMATAFIELNEKLWKTVTYKSAKPEYVEFINEIASQMQDQRKLMENERGGPKEIKVVFKMGRLSRNGPNSYAYAVHDLDEIGFVDVGVIDYQNNPSITRTFVVKKDDRWFAVPRPDLFPFLTLGLNEERRPSEYVYPK